MATKTKYFPLGGGLDVVSPALSIPPGRVLAIVNFSPWYNGGYRRVDGYERFDGRPRPSDAIFRGFDIDTTAGITLGMTLTGDTSGATGVVCGIWTDDGSYGANVVAVTKITGTFNVGGETLNTAAYTSSTSAVLNYAPTTTLEDTWIDYARGLYRADIGVVPGSGIVRGAWQRGAYNYAIRDNAGATAGVLHLGSTSGWTTTGVTMADYLYFNTGSGTEIFAGDTVTGASSGASGTVHRVILHSGSWGVDAVGYLVLTGVTGGPFTTGENLQVSAVTRAVADGGSSTFAFPVGGHYRFLNHNFYGGSGTYRTYGVNGVGPAFEIDENNVVSPILFPKTAIADQPVTNLPFLLEEHAGYLFLANPGGRFLQSVIGEPMNFNGFLGAAEFGIGDEITGLNSVVGNVLVITSERETRGLFGSSIADWQLKLIGERTGGKLYTAQKIDTVYALDDLGITSVARTDVFGDFAGSTVSPLVQPVINAMRDKTTDSTIVRSSNQYRVYFNDGSGLVMFVPNVNADTRRNTDKLPVEFGFLSYPIVVRKIFNTEDATGKERSYFCSDDGYVYEDQIGTSFDGADINAYIRTAFYHLETPSMRKRFRRCDLEINSNKPLTLKVTSDLSYGASEISSSLSDLTTTDVPVIQIFAGGGFWDVDNWDEFYWDGQNISTARANLRGTGENVSLLVFSQSKTAKPFILQGITYHYDVRRLQR